MDTQTRELINSLRSVMGSDLVAFMLAVNSGDLDQLSPNDFQLHVLTELEPCLEQLKSQYQYERSFAIVQMVCSHESSLGTSWATYLHYFCAGNTLPNFDAIKDTSEKSLMLIARDIYPAFLVPKDGPGLPGFYNALHLHPLQKTFNLSIMKASNPIRRLFPQALTRREYKNDPNLLLSLSGNVALSNGQLTTVYAAKLLEAILASSTCNVVEGEDQAIAYANSNRSTYRKVKRLANGGSVELNTLLGLGNIDLSAEVGSIKIANFTIRTLNPIDKQIVLSEVSEASVVVEISSKVKILGSYNTIEECLENHGGYDEIIKESFKSLESDINKIRLSMLLASDNSSFVAPSYSFTTSLSPLTLSRSTLISPYRWSTRYDRQVISSNRAADIKMWFGRTHKMPDKLSVSVRRLVSAVTERVDDSDAFIDAVMVWENLFGAKHETTFRIKGAMSMLLEPNDKAKRKLLMKEIGQLYDKRSRLVHGSPNVDMSNMHDDRSRSIKLALESLKCVLRKRDLLNAQDSEIRGQIIMFKVEYGNGS